MHLKPCRIFFLHESVIHVLFVDDSESNCTPSLANRVVTSMTSPLSEYLQNQKEIANMQKEKYCSYSFLCA